MILAKNYENLSKFVKVTAKILSVFFPDMVWIKVYDCGLTAHTGT